MNSIPELSKEELIDLLNRCWMTHDGVWFYHCFQELKEFFERAAPPLHSAIFRPFEKVGGFLGYCP